MDRDKAITQASLQYVLDGAGRSARDFQAGVSWALEYTRANDAGFRQDVSDLVDILRTAGQWTVQTKRRYRDIMERIEPFLTERN